MRPRTVVTVLVWCAAIAWAADKRNSYHGWTPTAGWPLLETIHSGMYVNMPPTWQPQAYFCAAQQVSVSISAGDTQVLPHKSVSEVMRNRYTSTCYKINPCKKPSLQRSEPQLCRTLSLPPVHASGALAVRDYKVMLEGDGFTATLQWSVSHLDGYHALWPIRPADARTRGIDAAPDVDDAPWDGTKGVRLASVMGSPFVPSTAHGHPDMAHASWSRGVAIRMPNSTAVPVRSPVAGTIVWSDMFNITKPPFDTHVNDITVWCVMLRDSSDLIHQIIGLDPGNVHVRSGDTVRAGDTIGYTPNDPLPEMPRDTSRPAEPVTRYNKEGQSPYPYRYHPLELRVGWTTNITAPDDMTFFNPLSVYPTHDYRIDLHPLPDSDELYIGIPDGDIHAADVKHPVVVSGTVSLYSKFTTYYPTPGDPNDCYDNQGLYSLEWAVWRDGETGEDAAWNTLFELATVEKYPGLPLENIIPEIRVHPSPRLPFGSRLVTRFDDTVRDVVYGARNVWFTEYAPNGRYTVAMRARGFFGPPVCVNATVIVANYPPLNPARVMTDIMGALNNALRFTFNTVYANEFVKIAIKAAFKHFIKAVINFISRHFGQAAAESTATVLPQ